MTRLKKEALNAEFTFTGMWEQAYKTEAIAAMKDRAKAKYKGYKTRVVREDNGVSIYVEKRWCADEAKRNLEKKIAGYEARKAEALKKYEAELTHLAKEQADYIAELDTLNK